MATFNKFQSFVEALAEKKHNLGSDQLKIALTNSAPLATNTVLADITEISYTNLSGATPLNVTTTSSAQTSGTYKLVLADLVLNATGNVGAFRYIVLYNNTATNKELIGYYDYGTSATISNGESFTLDFDNSAGALTLV
jgi:hypothetical protein